MTSDSNTPSEQPNQPGLSGLEGRDPATASPTPSQAASRDEPVPTASESEPQGQYFAPPTAVAPATVKRPSEFKRGFGKGFGFSLGLLVTFVAVSVIGSIMAVISFAAMMGSVSGDATTATNVIWGTPGAEGRLRAIEINGEIQTSPADGGLFSTGTYGYEIADMLDSLTEEDSDGVVLLVNTPGGSVTGSKAILDATVRYQERTGNKVLVHVSEMSASGGVYSTAAADEIVADYGSMVGSIGVIFGPIARYDGVTAIGSTAIQSGVTTSGGITQEYITAGTGKDFGNPFRDMTEAERTMVQNMVDEYYGGFVDVVSQHRDIPAEKITDELGASVFTGEGAIEAGLVDAVMGREDFFRYAAEQTGLDPDNTAVEAVADPNSLQSLLGVTRSYGVSPAIEADQTVSASFCAAPTILAYYGDPVRACG